MREAACHAFVIFEQGHAMGRPHLERMLLDKVPAVVVAARAALAAKPKP